MSSKEVKQIVIDKMFTKWFVQGRSNNRKPDYIANIARNVRIRNWGMTVRDGWEQLYEGTGDEVQGIIGNNGELLFVHDNTLKKLNTTTNAVTSIQAIDSTGGKVWFIGYGIYTIILTGVDYPWVYDWSTCTQLTSTNIAVNVNPSFGVRYAGFTVVNSQIGAKNVIRISRPIGVATQTNSYMWDLTNGSESITYDTEVLWLESSMNFLWVFTKSTIEKMTKDNLTTAWGVQSLFTLPIAKWQEVLNNDCIVSAGDIVLFITANKQVATIEYKSTNPTEPVLTIISDRMQDLTDVQDWLDNLNEDQSKAFGIFDKKRNLVKRYFRSFTSTVNDVCLVYDITNTTFYVDDNKYFNCETELNTKYYAGGVFGGDIYEDEVGKNDGDEGIDWEYSVDMIAGTKFRKKILWSGLSGVINYPAKIKWEVEVDDILEFSDYIYGTNYNENDSDLGIWWSMTGELPIWWEIAEPYEDNNPFTVRITDSRLRANGEKIRMRWSGNEQDQDFVLDYLDVSYKPLRTVETDTKF